MLLAFLRVAEDEHPWRREPSHGSASLVLSFRAEREICCVRRSVEESTPRRFAPRNDTSNRTTWPKNTKTSSPEKEKRLRENGTKSRLPESHVPRLRERVGTKQSRYMIATRLPWRHRARPSATLHEIQSQPAKVNLEIDVTGATRVCQASTLKPVAGSSSAQSATSMLTILFIGIAVSLLL